MSRAVNHTCNYIFDFIMTKGQSSSRSVIVLSKRKRTQARAWSQKVSKLKEITTDILSKHIKKMNLRSQMVLMTPITPILIIF